MHLTPANKVKLSLKVSNIKSLTSLTWLRTKTLGQHKDLVSPYTCMHNTTRAHNDAIENKGLCFFNFCERIDTPTCSQDVRNITSFMQSENVLTQKSVFLFFFMKYQWGQEGRKGIKRKEPLSNVFFFLFLPLRRGS